MNRSKKVNNSKKRMNRSKKVNHSKKRANRSKKVNRKQKFLISGGAHRAAPLSGPGEVFVFTPSGKWEKSGFENVSLEGLDHREFWQGNVNLSPDEILEARERNLQLELINKGDDTPEILYRLYQDRVPDPSPKPLCNLGESSMCVFGRSNSGLEQHDMEHMVASLPGAEQRAFRAFSEAEARGRRQDHLVAPSLCTLESFLDLFRKKR